MRNSKVMHTMSRTRWATPVGPSPRPCSHRQQYRFMHNTVWGAGGARGNASDHGVSKAHGAAATHIGFVRVHGVAGECVRETKYGRRGSWDRSPCDRRRSWGRRSPRGRRNPCGANTEAPGVARADAGPPESEWSLATPQPAEDSLRPLHPDKPDALLAARRCDAHRSASASLTTAENVMRAHGRAGPPAGLFLKQRIARLHVHTPP